LKNEIITMRSVVISSVLGYIGYMLSKAYHWRINYMIVFAYLILTFLAFQIGMSTRLISIFSFSVMMNQVLGSIAGGFTVRVLVKFKLSKQL